MGDIMSQEKENSVDWTSELCDLAPINNVDNFDTYEKALNWAFGNERVKNIALSGPYGSGKSSIIETYLCRNEKVKKSTLKVSLATFTSGVKQEQNQKDKNLKWVDIDTRNSEGPEMKVGINEDEIEKAILKQLFYKVKPNTIPLSRFRKLRPQSWRDRVKAFVVAFFLIILCLTLVVPSISVNLFKVIDSLFLWGLVRTSLARVIEITIFSALVSMLFCWMCGNILPKIHIKEITIFSNTTIQNGETENESVFNRNLDEIIYFFEATKYNTVLFEDLDRLDNSRVFVHLRELNYLINNDESIKRKPVRFVYTVKDDIFLSEDRTKFFDFIIPVVPVANSLNSGDILINLIKGIDQELAESCSDIAAITEIYIRDLRMIKNICNEYSVYKSVLLKAVADKIGNNVEFKKKLLAMIIFKNVYPNEYARAQDAKGLLKKAFVYKNEFIKSESRKPGKRNLYGARLIDLFSREDYSPEVIFKEDVLNSELLVAMLYNGFIAEDYSCYITYGTDYEFIRYVRNQKEPPLYLRKLFNPSMVVERLKMEDFRCHSACNFDVLEELIRGGHHAKIRAYIRMLTDFPGVEWWFIDYVFAYSKYGEIFIQTVIYNWPQFWWFVSVELRTYGRLRGLGEEKIKILKGSELDDKIYLVQSKHTQEEMEIIYFSEILRMRDIEVFKKQDGDNGWMKKYLEEKPDILKKLNLETDKRLMLGTKEAISALGVKFETIDAYGVNPEVIDFILEKNCYKLNPRMIQEIMLRKGNIMEEEWNRAPYSSILTLGYQALTNRVQREVEVFVKGIILESDGVLDDKSKDVIDLLIRLVGDVDTQVRLIDKEKFEICEIKECAFFEVKKNPKAWSKVWGELLKKDKINISWENVVIYYRIYELDEVLKDYIKRHAVTLNRCHMDEKLDKSMFEFMKTGFEEVID